VSKSNGATDHATYTFDGIGYGWTRDYARANRRLSLVSAMINASPREGLSAAELETVRMGKIEGLQELDDLEIKRDALLCQVLTGVPRSWLVADAPDEIDWRNPDNLQYVLATRFEDLLNDASDARASAEKK
jgi:hypothetical protein